MEKAIETNSELIAVVPGGLEPKHGFAASATAMAESAGTTLAMTMERLASAVGVLEQAPPDAPPGRLW